MWGQGGSLPGVAGGAETGAHYAAIPLLCKGFPLRKGGHSTPISALLPGLTGCLRVVYFLPAKGPFKEAPPEWGVPPQR
jgi:hypothetical protein